MNEVIILAMLPNRTLLLFLEIGKNTEFAINFKTFFEVQKEKIFNVVIKEVGIFIDRHCAHMFYA